MQYASKKYSIETTDYYVGQDNTKKWGFDIHTPVFLISSGLILAFLIAVLSTNPATAKAAIDQVRNGIMNQFDDLFMWSTNFFLIFALILTFSPFGKIRLGGKDAVPEHSTKSWISMLFAAGMGSGVLFWSVAEPAADFTNWYYMPLNATPNSPATEPLALATTIFHWGIHGWAIFALVALGLAFFCFNKGLPLSMRSIFYPIMGDRAWGWFGHIIDILSVLATLFGLVTSLGIGAQQATSGINHVFGTHGGLGMSLLVIAVVTLITIGSVARGINGGVKLLSNINMYFAFALFVFLVIVTHSIAWDSLKMAVSGYIENIIPLSNTVGRDDKDWMHAWTVFYWAWWISWSPFVGTFIARVSRGRTVREFLIAVMVLPTLVIVLWMAVFGGLALDQIVNKVGELGTNGLTDISLTLFYIYDQLPLGNVLSILSIFLILVFFITSSDSGSLVIDSITAGGKVDSPLPQRVFWATLEGAIAATMLWVGGEQSLQALQSGVVVTGLPFTFVLLLMCVSLVMGLRSEYQVYHAPKVATA
ncbi:MULTISPECIES: BCCT family transporter [Vibrio]|uniref:BCCT family transporter n=2 Tax=Vibrio TaxID=662 RepID=A0A7X4LM06_9VIBR|nr:MULTISPECIES: BCCT family transporter [Vibrio]MBF9000150.1 BCCT family transporter [Vibrio nitrifigilis]MZI94394.1 BCCT family transporter [Vibrio eleionomae]